MTRRSIQNERNTGDGPEGVTRKSASKAKPVRKAASTVYVKSGQKSRKELKQEAAAKEQKRKEKAAALQSSPDAQGVSELREQAKLKMRKWRRIWWGALILAIIAIVVSFISYQTLGSLYYVCLVVSYGSIAVALFIEFGKIRKLKKQVEQEDFHARRSPKQIKHDLEALKQEEARKAERKSRGLLGTLKGKMRKNETTADLPMDE